MESSRVLGAWDMKPCCNFEERLFIGLYVTYWVLTQLLWRFEILKPMKLLGVFVHEMSHASATWLSCGKVRKIEVYACEGGVTAYEGGARWLITPAGYVGGAFWGGAFVFLSANRIGATVAACLVSTALLLSLVHNPNKVVVYISIGFLVVTVSLMLVEWLAFSPFLQYFTLFYGVFLGYYAVRDIWDDCVKSTKDGSDAVACTKQFPFLLPRCVGISFLLMGVLFQILGMYFAMVWLTRR